jgi:cytochrome c biogenesis protein CcmG, thiol:disulfide interchange protein DsbE
VTRTEEIVVATRTEGVSPRRLLLYVGIIAGVALLLFAAFGLGDDAGDAPSVAEVAGDVEVTGEGLPPGEDPASDPAVGQATPVISGEDFDGEPVTVGEADAELVVFMASWCPACQAEMPELVEWLESGGLPDGVELTAVSTGLDDSRPNWPPQAWFEREGYGGVAGERVIVDDADGTIASTLGMTATPYWVAIADGEIQGRIPGQLPMSQVQQIVDSLAAGS